MGNPPPLPLAFAALVAACGDAPRPQGAASDASVGLTQGSLTQASDTTAAEADSGDKLDLAAGLGDTPPVDTAGEPCDGLQATIRDFQAAHPDFEDYSGDVASVGLVLSQLGGDGTPSLDPAYAGAPMITSADSFAQWYHDVPGINLPFPIELTLVEESPGSFVYDNSAFFPIDGMGFGDEGNPHNYHFTTEVHTSFTYGGGEVFTFRGDDDLWMFVDGRLAIDLGGLHPALEASVDMDTMGLSVGETYAMDIFHAERHTDESNFRIVTTIDCFVTPPPPG